MIKRLAISGVAIAALMTASPSFAADIIQEAVVEEQAAWYVSLHGGIKFSEDWEHDVSGITLDGFKIPIGQNDYVWCFGDAGCDVSGSGETKTDSGWRIGGAIGRQFNSFFSVEGELSYMRQDIDSVHLDEVTITENKPEPDSVTLACTGVGGVADLLGGEDSDCTQSADGDLSIITAMVNAYLGIPIGGIFRPYVGAGIGLAHVSINDAGLTGDLSAICCLDDSDTSLALQGMVGVDVGITETIAIGVRGRVLHVGSVEVEDSAGFNHDLDPDLIKSLEAVLTIGF